ncbi:Capsule biosynthesis protein CapA [Enhygromyxa salina]|uniref:Capsule biosynthesis protein CapA n=1 Tax=Enhygromyxa salina TaxID=215803 RepID=A0A2S9XJW0_9BACT|nr:CapA family protein [Enhygromyxa salina]PRP93166.1 Capsule biosynthesis protein CapA [Enhygromyxa salina]
MSIFARYPHSCPFWIGLTAAALTSVIAAPLVHAYQFDDEEQAYQDLVLATPIALHGRVVDSEGLPVEGAQLRLIAWGDNIANDGEATMAWSGGDFELNGLERRNALLEVSMPGYYSEILPVNLQVELGETTVEFGDIELVAEQFGRARMTFAGDTMFDRRMFDDGLLHLESLESDTEALFRYIEPLLEADDHTAINLETPVTDDLSTPHPSKSYVFAAHSESAAELPGVGVDSVSLGNNHIYDHLDLGLAETLFHLDTIGLPAYGAGMDPDSTRAAVHRPNINGVEVSLQGFSNFIGYSYGGTELQVVTRPAPLKGGALPSFSSELDAFVDAEVAAGRFAIPVIHGGTEYALTQSSGMHTDFERVVEHGAGLVVAHHPHVTHGVSVIDAGDGPRFVFGSLGNIVFDQEIYETFRSYLAIVDIAEGPSGPAVERVRLAPVRLDDYAPRPLVGAGLADMGRHVAHLSTAEASVSGFDRAVVFAEGGRLVVAADESEVLTTDLLDARDVDVVDGSTGLVTLDPYTSTDALAALSSDAPATCELGRDLLGIGDFEDPDVDNAYLEGDLWVQSSSRYIQGSETHTGTGAAVLLRKDSYSSRTSLWMGNSLEINAGRDMTISGWHKGENAGEFSVTVLWMTSSGSTISHTIQYQNFDGDFDWSRFTIDVTAPANADKLKVYFRHYPPAGGGDGELFLDDINFIEWDPGTHAVDGSGVNVATPNAWDFVRCAAADGPLELNLTHRVYESYL